MKEIGTLTLVQVKEYIKDLIQYDILNGQNHQNLHWLPALIWNKVSSSIVPLVEPIYDQLDIEHNNGAVYLRLVLEQCFLINDWDIELLQAYIRKFGKNGLSSFEGENVNMAATEIITIAQRLEQLMNCQKRLPKKS